MVVRNNLATDYDLAGTNVTGDHNVEFTMANAGTLFVAPPFDLHLKPGTAAVDTGAPRWRRRWTSNRCVARPQGAGFDLGACEAVHAPTVSVDDVAVVEGTGSGASAVFHVTLSGSSAQAVTMGCQTYQPARRWPAATTRRRPARSRSRPARRRGP